MKIKDNFLDKEEFSIVNQTISDDFFPWFFQREQVVSKDDGFYFSHKLYDLNKVCSPYYDKIVPVFKKKLKYFTLMRVTCNLLTNKYQSFKSSFHTDFLDPKNTTAIFYINTNNGCTEIKNVMKIKSIQNRLIEFSGLHKHRSISQTDETRRMVINFNYISEVNSKGKSYSEQMQDDLEPIITAPMMEME